MGFGHVMQDPPVKKITYNSYQFSSTSFIIHYAHSLLIYGFFKRWDSIINCKFCWKMYSLCENNSISKKYTCLLFVVTVYIIYTSKNYTNSEYTLNVLRKPWCFN